MSYLVIAIALTLVAWVITPLLRREGSDRVLTPDENVERLLEMKHAVYRSILDLEHDSRLGKVSDADHAILRQQHEAEAIAIMEQLDSHPHQPDLQDALEREIAEARRRLTER